MHNAAVSGSSTVLFVVALYSVCINKLTTEINFNVYFIILNIYHALLRLLKNNNNLLSGVINK